MAQDTTTEKPEKPYADYEWYSEEYKGTLLTEEEFPKYARWASYLVDTITYGNIKSSDDVLDCVKDAVCAAAELAYDYYKSNVGTEEGRGMRSETNDGYSVSFSNTLDTAESLQEECRATILIYLQNSGLLSRRVKRRPWWYG